MEDPSQWGLRTARNAVPVKVVERTGKFTGISVEMTETYIIQSSRLLDFFDACFPVPIVFNGFPLYQRRMYANGLPACVAQEVSIEGLVGGRPIDPFDSDSEAPDGTYEPYLRVVVNYATSEAGDAAPSQTDPKTFLQVTASSGGSFLTEDLGTKARWRNPEGDLVAVDDKDSKRIIVESSTEWNVRWRSIPWAWFQSTYKSRLDNAMGKVNSVDMSLFHSAPAETVLFSGYDYGQDFSYLTGYNGEPFIEANLKFSERNFKHDDVQVTWNRFWNPEYNQYLELLVDGENPVYNTTDLMSLFRA